jgi:hypothetical protein
MGSRPRPPLAEAFVSASLRFPKKGRSAHSVALGFGSLQPRKRPMATNWQPKGYHTVTPTLIIRDAAAAIEF